MAVATLWDVFNSVSFTLGFPNFDAGYPSVIQEIFQENGFKGDTLEFRSLNHDSGIKLSEDGFDLSECHERISALFDRALMTKPIMQCKDDFGYKGIVLHVEGKKNSKRTIYLSSKSALQSFKGVSTYADLYAKKRVHEGMDLPVSKLELICYIFRNKTQIFTLEKESGRCLQHSVSTGSPPLEGDLASLFIDGAKMSKDTLSKLLKGTHEELQLKET